MPSPFPGMDPYLEHPGLWPDVHHELLSVARTMLNDKVKPIYYTRIRERSPKLSDASAREVSSSDEEIPRRRIEIIDRFDRTVVTVIEVLSPDDKTRGSRGHQDYEQVRRQAMHSSAHFVEIDLLRGGQRFAPTDALPPRDYQVFASSVHRRTRIELWPNRLQERLPVIPIPLKEQNAHTTLDLQAVLSAAYERAAYALEVNYRLQPEPPLSAEQSQWADALLREKGLRA